MTTRSASPVLVRAGLPRTWLSRIAATVTAACLAVAAVVAAPSAARAVPWPTAAAAYSAESTIQVGEMRIGGRVWHDHGRERREMNVQGVSQIVIMRPDRNTAYMIMPQMNSGFEMDFGAAGLPSPEQMLNGLQPVPEGRETVEGLDTTRYRVSGNAADGSTVEGQVWVTEDGIVMRFEGTARHQDQTQTVRMSLQNVVRGPQEASLFEPPAGINMMRMDSNMMRQLPGMSGSSN